MLVVMDFVILILRTRKENPWRIIYIESMPKSKHAAPFDLITFYASKRSHIGQLQRRNRSRAQPAIRPQLLALQLPPDVVGGANQRAEPVGQFVDPAAIVGRDF